MIEMTHRRVFSKPEWQKVIGITKKARRLRLTPSTDGKYFCPVQLCDSEGYNSQRGCRKHVFKRHGWYFFFDEKPDIAHYFPEVSTRNNKNFGRVKRTATVNMPSFLKSCNVAKLFISWLRTPGGGGKCPNQALQICCKILKYLKFCCDDVCESWNIPNSVADYCMGSVSMMSEFVTYLQDTWKVGYSGVIGYMNSLCHFLDFRRSSVIDNKSIPVFMASEVYLDRVKKCLSKQMKIEWNSVLSIEHLSAINCWATLEEMQSVIPFHSEKFTQILLNCSNVENVVPSHDISFATSFIVAVLFLMVKASRPMTYQFLTTEMVHKLPCEGGIIDQTQFKTNYKYGFDSLVISKEVLQILKGYTECIRPRLNPQCNYLLVSRTGKQIRQLCDVFGRLVYLAIGKHIHPTRYRQIIETESATKLSESEQNIISRDQKHTSNVAKVHYQKIQSREVAIKAQECMKKLISGTSHQNPWNVTILGSDCDSNKSCDSSQIENIGVDMEVTRQQPNKRQKKVAFSKQEDSFLFRGIKKYGPGKWSSILSDTEFSFHSSRKCSTLLIRARTLKLIS